MALHLDILNAAAAVITGLGLTSGGTTIPVEVAQEPHYIGGADAQPKIFVCPGPQAKEERLAMEGMWGSLKQAEITFWSSGNLDLRSAKLQEGMDAEDAIVKALRTPPLTPLTCIYQVDVPNIEPCNRGTANKGFFKGGVTLNFWALLTVSREA